MPFEEHEKNLMRYFDGEMNAQEREEFKRHLETCESCKTALEDMSALKEVTDSMKIAELPENVTGNHMLGMAFLAGVGFTMAIFIANLAYPGDQFLMDSSIVGILIGSFVSGIIGFSILKFATRNKSNASK